MRIPRRVPWASASELEQVCSWIFADENDLDSHVLALSRVCRLSPCLFTPFSHFSVVSLESDNLSASCPRIHSKFIGHHIARQDNPKSILFPVIEAELRRRHYPSGQWTS